MAAKQTVALEELSLSELNQFMYTFARVTELKYNNIIWKMKQKPI